MSRWIRFWVAVILGAVIGLLYGWVVNPAVSADTSLEALRADYRADYVLMVAESYQAERDLAVAVKRLALISDASPQESVRQALALGSQIGYTPDDLALLRQLGNDLQNLDLGGGKPES